MQEPQEMQVRSLGHEDPLEEGMATHSSILAWRIPWTEEPGRLQSIGFFREAHWSGVACPPPRDLPNPGIEPASLMSPALAGGFFTTTAPGKPQDVVTTAS